MKPLSESLKKMKINQNEFYNSDEKLVIALDFGTTFSGIAFCFPHQRNPKVVSILDWPGMEGESVPKIPTLINYDSSDKFSWGAQVSRLSDNIVGVKLMLDPNQERPLYLPTGNVKRDIKKLPKEPVAIVADYISAIYNHALKQIEKEVPKGYVPLCQKHFVLSVPANWSDAAKNATLQAAKRAGIFPVTLIKEPEAAALYTLHSLDFCLKENDAFVICDAGGGTVDLISYEVITLSPKLQLKELVPGKAGMAGSLGLNQRFREAVQNLVGEDQFHTLRKSNGFSLAEKTFDREIKKQFRGDPKEEYFVNFPMTDLEDEPSAGLQSNTWRMTGRDLHDIFAPLITDILRLIDDQIKSVRIKRPGSDGVTGIFLVGGFGSSQYLKACVEKQHPGIQVLQPNDAWAAIAKGAALSKLPKEAAVVSTSSTKHYGVEAWDEYESDLDVGQPTCIRRDGTKKVLAMTWYIAIGEDISRDQKIRFPYYRDLYEDYDKEELIFDSQLISCEDPEAPRHRSKGSKFGSACTLICDMKDADISNSQRIKARDGKTLIRVAYDIVVSLDSAIMSFSIEMDGKEMGSVQASFTD